MTINDATDALQKELEHYPWLTGVGAGGNIIFVYYNSKHMPLLLLDYIQRGYQSYQVKAEKVGTVKAKKFL